MIRALLLLHRYLGIVLGILVSLWCLSAFVMMYVRYPSLSEAEALAGLDSLDLAGCCEGLSKAIADAPVRGFRIESVAGRPVLRIPGGASGLLQIDLRSGRSITGIDATTAEAQATRYLANAGIAGAVHSGTLIRRDQWTVAGGFEPHRPLYRFRADDAAATEIYVSGTTGEVVQQSTGTERFWNWFGSVVHWLYPVVLRQHPGAWVQTITWTTIVSLFLVVTGIWIGLRQYRARGGGRKSPYRGAALWHHYFGLVCGLLTLTWLASGLFSVNPWGFLESGGAGEAQRRLAGPGIDPAGLPAMFEALQQWQRAGGSGDVVRIDSSVLAGDFALLAYAPDGGSVRRDPSTLAPRPIARSDLERAAGLLATVRAPIASAGMMANEDNYYFAHHEAVRLPVYRVILDDDDRTRFYVDPHSGRLLMKVDANGRWQRWLFEALHRGDFAGWLRRRPVWDIVVLCLLLGVTISTLTGTWLGGKRLLGRRSGGRREREIAARRQ